MAMTCVCLFVCDTYYFYGILPVNTLGGLVDRSPDCSRMCPTAHLAPHLPDMHNSACQYPSENHSVNKYRTLHVCLFVCLLAYFVSTKYAAS